MLWQSLGIDLVKKRRRKNNNNIFLKFSLEGCFKYLFLILDQFVKIIEVGQRKIKDTHDMVYLHGLMSK